MKLSPLWIRRITGSLTFLPTLLLSSCPLAAQTPAASRPKDPVARDAPQGQAQRQAAHLTFPGAVALSPDGETIAWTMRGAGSSGLYLSSTAHPAAEAEKQVLVPGATGCSYATPIWSPDGKTLAFLSDCAPLEGKQAKGQMQIFLWSQASGEVHQLTHLTGEVQQPAWAPDGRSIAFLFVENASRSAGALDAMKPWAGVIGEDGVEVQRVAAVQVDGAGAGYFLTPANLHVYEFNWAPTAHQIALIAANPPGENNWWVAKLYTASVTAEEHTTSATQMSDHVSEELHVVLDPTTVSGPLHGLQIAVPRFSPDGKHIALIGGLMSDQGSTGGDVYVVDAAGGEPTDVTPGIDGTPCYEEWISDHTISFAEDRRGHTLLNAVNTNSKQIVPGAPLDLGEVSLGGGAIKDAFGFSNRIGSTKNRLVAFTLQSFTKPPEVYTVTGGGQPQQITHLNDGAQPSARTESVEWTNGPFHVQGWLTFPAHYDPSKKYPLIVSVHGGPSASVGARWGVHLWADKGYFELQPNPRGSFGQGEAFTEANRKDFGYGDLKDIEAGMDSVEAKYPIDHNREGLTGWSYGGFMTMFGVTQTTRFRAAVAGAGISDWLSYYGENSIDQWMTPFFGASVYDDPAVYAKSSAITYIKQVKTPTLVIVGDRDGECPAPQSFEFWHALRAEGVKTQLVIYPNEGHGFRNPEHIHDRDERAAAWFAEYMPATP